jgi:hypothetical protein
MRTKVTFAARAMMLTVCGIVVSFNFQRACFAEGRANGVRVWRDKNTSG